MSGWLYFAGPAERAILLPRLDSRGRTLLLADEDAHGQTLERLFDSHGGQHQRVLRTDNQMSKVFNEKAIRKSRATRTPLRRTPSSSYARNARKLLPAIADHDPHRQSADAVADLLSSR